MIHILSNLPLSPSSKQVNCVRAQVKLKFRDIYNKVPIATKNLELSVSHDRNGKIKTSIKTLDFALKFDETTRVR